jgi:tRNA threonylcarbamoyladenosine biosynthesis protein TsaE
MFRTRITSPECIDETARQLLASFPDKKIFAFYGEIGAGKTTLIKALCRVLQVSDVTSSPSFGLIHEYRADREKSVYHFDFYRIERAEEVLDIGFEEYIYSGNYCFLEWPEIIESILPGDTVRLKLDHHDDGSREIYELS